MTKLYHAILEIEGHPNGKDARRFLSTLEDIRRSSIEGNNVIAAINTQEDMQPTRVQHYGYNYKCEPNCPHESASYGILRYFGIELVIEGDVAIGEVYKPNTYSRLDICGYDIPYTAERNDMTMVKVV